MTNTEREIMIAAGLTEEDFKPVTMAQPDEYSKKVERLIRERYTVSDELAILRQRDTKPSEFAEYNAFCEECKLKAKIIKYNG